MSHSLFLLLLSRRQDTAVNVEELHQHWMALEDNVVRAKSSSDALSLRVCVCVPSHSSPWKPGLGWVIGLIFIISLTAVPGLNFFQDLCLCPMSVSPSPWWRGWGARKAPWCQCQTWSKTLISGVWFQTVYHCALGHHNQFTGTRWDGHCVWGKQPSSSSVEQNRKP